MTSHSYFDKTAAVVFLLVNLVSWPLVLFVQVGEGKDVLFCVLVEGFCFSFLCQCEVFLTVSKCPSLATPRDSAVCVASVHWFLCKRQGLIKPSSPESKPYFGSITAAAFKNPCPVGPDCKIRGECIGMRHSHVLLPKQLLVSGRVKMVYKETLIFSVRFLIYSQSAQHDLNQLREIAHLLNAYASQSMGVLRPHWHLGI